MLSFSNLQKKAENFVSIIFAPIIENDKISIGRAILVSCFVMAMIKWWHGTDIGDSHLTVLLTMIGYIFGNKVISNAKDAITKVAEIKASVKSNKPENI